MPQAKPFNVNEDMEKHPEISKLIRAVMHGDPFFVAEGKDGPNGADYVIIGGGDHQFQFTKGADGYTFKQTR
ncbi:hypothetical protein [Burkholderia vietnamiensis]|uniref:hypothetical protein n=1 Tax=Burkholderia vietnamiensis TaxID=60552 RepID=UPI001594D977|nr:hypothetical protein [Burkholderia vietnamiensis]MCA8270356.1 hypothetical protein [Burkholderia vietnamiensis]